jgi:eukaryotic-like serine/threonine-protein kinase
MTQGPASFSLPERLGQWYAPVSLLGSGTFGVVIKALDRDQGNHVAIKLLKGVGNAEESERLLREGRVAGMLQSKHIVRVYGAGWDRELPSGRQVAYLIMEFLEGRTLQAVLEERGALPPEEAVAYVLDVCEALAEAHGHIPPFVHRDLKPANLLMARGDDGAETLKVLDFGLVKVERYEEDGTRVDPLTRSKALTGTPAYMAPEQIVQGGIDPRTDIWAVGVLLFRLLAGQAPFRATSLPQTLLAVVRQPAPSLLEGRPGFPPGLDAAVQRCLQKDASRRYQDVGQLALDLAPFAPASRRGAAERIAARLVAPRS